MKDEERMQTLLEESAVIHRDALAELLENTYLAGAAAIVTSGASPADIPELAKSFAARGAAWRVST